MPSAHWFRPPRRVLAIFLCIMLVCSGALGWLGWQVLEQDRSLEGQRLQERLGLAASQMAASLEHNLLDLDSYLNFLPGPASAVRIALRSTPSNATVLTTVCGTWLKRLNVLKFKWRLDFLSAGRS